MQNICTLFQMYTINSLRPMRWNRSTLGVRTALYCTVNINCRLFSLLNLIIYELLQYDPLCASSLKYSTCAANHPILKSTIPPNTLCPPPPTPTPHTLTHLDQSPAPNTYSTQYARTMVLHILVCHQVINDAALNCSLVVYVNLSFLIYF